MKTCLQFSENVGFKKVRNPACPFKGVVFKMRFRQVRGSGGEGGGGINEWWMTGSALAVLDVLLL